MKWAALAVFIIMIPVLQAWLKSNTGNAPYVWGLLGFLPLLSEGLHIVIAPISWPYWPGYVKGFEVSAVESIALAVLLSRNSSPGGLSFKWLWIAYIIAIVISAAFAPVPAAALFAAWQALRMLLVFAAVASIATDDRGPKALIAGMTIGLVINACVAIEQRLGGTLQAAGLFSHQNIAGMASHFVAFPALAMLLADSKYKIGFLSVFAAGIMAIAGASRGTIGLAAFGYSLVLILSLARKPTSRKTTVLALGAVAMLAIAPLAIGSLDKRFAASQNTNASYDERAVFEKAARSMWKDHPMGVGANQFVNVANVDGYWEGAGVAGVTGSRSAHVHNVYLLVGAEMGYLGLFAFLALLGGPIILAFRKAWHNKNDSRGDLMIGLGTSLFIVAIHSFFEWVFVTYAIQWLFSINSGIIVGVAAGMGKRPKSLGLRTARKSRNQKAVVNHKNT